MNKAHIVAQVTYTDRLTMGERIMTYYVTRAGLHRVALSMVAGEDICDNVHNVADADEARVTWKQVVGDWKSRGLVKTSEVTA